MSGNYAQDWKPRNLGGRIYYDPRDELRYWAARADNDPMVAVPVATIRAVAELRECSARRIVRADEDGPLTHPVEIVCRKPSGHENDHSNGYSSWPRDRSQRPEEATYLLEVSDSATSAHAAPTDSATATSPTSGREGPLDAQR